MKQVSEFCCSPGGLGHPSYFAQSVHPRVLCSIAEDAKVQRLVRLCVTAQLYELQFIILGLQP